MDVVGLGGENIDDIHFYVNQPGINDVGVLTMGTGTFLTPYITSGACGVIGSPGTTDLLFAGRCVCVFSCACYCGRGRGLWILVKPCVGHLLSLVFAAMVGCTGTTLPAPVSMARFGRSPLGCRLLRVLTLGTVTVRARFVQPAEHDWP